MLHLCSPRDQESRLGESEVRSSKASQSPEALVWYLRPGPATAIRDPAIVFVEPLGDAGKHEGQGVAPRIPHIRVKETNVSVFVHVIVAGRSERRVRNQNFGHAAGV